jgi:hypothetical protein
MDSIALFNSWSSTGKNMNIFHLLYCMYRIISPKYLFWLAIFLKMFMIKSYRY